MRTLDKYFRLIVDSVTRMFYNEFEYGFEIFGSLILIRIALQIELTFMLYD